MVKNKKILVVSTLILLVGTSICSCANLSPDISSTSSSQNSSFSSNSISNNSVESTSSSKVDSSNNSSKNSPSSSGNSTTSTTSSSKDSSSILSSSTSSSSEPIITYEVSLEVEGKVTTLTVNKGQEVGELDRPSKEGYYFKGWLYNGSLISFDTKINSNMHLVALFEELSKDSINISCNGLLNQIDVSWTKYEGATNYLVYFCKNGTSNYELLDSNLVQVDNLRASIIGIEKGYYDVKVIPVVNNSALENLKGVELSIKVNEYDKTGYAHFNASEGVGAYNNNGTLKENAVRVFVNDSNKNTLKTTIDGITYNGLGELISNASKINKPLDIVFTSQITTDQFKEKSYSISDLYNEYEGKYEILNGAITKLSTAGKEYTGTKIDNPNVIYSTEGKGASSSYTNMMYVNDAKNITVEGVFGSGLYQWGFDFKNCNSIEVRNLSFKDYPEDAIGFESGDNSTATKYGRYFFHHNEIYRGKCNWAFESDKNEGDGGFDVKRVGNVTCSYNKFIKLHKSGLIGSSNDSITYNCSYHHNFYNQAESRLPLGRQANMHFYNNYYYYTGTSQDVRANGYMLSENNFFFKVKEPQKIDSTGKIKSYNDIIYASNKESQATKVDSRTTKIENTCNPIGTDFSNFDQDEKLFYGVNTSSLENFLDTKDVPSYVKENSGYSSSYTSTLTPSSLTEGDFKGSIIDKNTSYDMNNYSFDETNPILIYTSDGAGNPRKEIKTYTNKLGVTYKDKTYNIGAKFDSYKPGCLFNISKKMKLTALVSPVDTSILNISSYCLNGNEYQTDSNLIQVELEKGSYELSISSLENKFYLYYVELEAI